MAAIVGPTASGKSAVAMEVAELAGACIVSVDSMQVYRGMDIGTAKPSLADRARVPHHMIDLAEPEDPFTVAEFQSAARAAIAGESRPVLLVGGSGLHFRSVVDPLDFPPTDPDVRAGIEAMGEEAAAVALLDLDPAAADLIDMQNPRRVARALEVARITGKGPSARAETPEAIAVAEYRSVVPVSVVGVDPGDDLPVRIAARFDAMVSAGFHDEVAGLSGRLGPTASQAVGYSEVAAGLAGETSEEQARSRTLDATAALAKRQRTFFRRDPRVEWLDHTSARDILKVFEEAGWTS